MEILITNTKVKVQSLPLITKGNQSLSSLSGADISGSSDFNYVWFLAQCSGLAVVTGINYVPGVYNDAKTTRFYKINKVTHVQTLIAEYTAQDSELGNPKHLDVNVELSENEYIGMAGTMYYAMTGSNSFSYNVSTDTISDNRTNNLWYNIEGYEQLT